MSGELCLDMGEPDFRVSGPKRWQFDADSGDGWGSRSGWVRSMGVPVSHRRSSEHRVRVTNVVEGVLLKVAEKLKPFQCLAM